MPNFPITPAAAAIAASPRLPASLPVPIAEGGHGEATAAAGFAALKQAATDTATGVVELATSAEVTTGTDTTRALTPAALAGSAPTFDGSNLTNLPSSGSTVTLPTVIGTRWTDGGLIGPNVYADYNATVDGTTTALVSSPGDAVQYNTARFATLKATTGVITVEHDGTTTAWDWSPNTYTSGTNVWTLGDRGFFEIHVRTADAANAGGTGAARCDLLLRATGALGNPGKWFSVYHKAAATNEIRAVYYNGFSGAYFGAGVTPTNGQMDVGYWHRFEWEADGQVRLYRVAGAAGSRPSMADYAFVEGSATGFTAGTLVDAGWTQINEASTGTDDEFVLTGARCGRGDLAVVIT